MHQGILNAETIMVPLTSHKVTQLNREELVWGGSGRAGGEGEKVGWMGNEICLGRSRKWSEHIQDIMCVPGSQAQPSLDPKARRGWSFLNSWLERASLKR